MTKYTAATAPKWIFPLFIVVGLAGTFFLFVKPCADVLFAQKWVQQQCIIIKSEVKTTIDSENSKTTKIDIRYDYVYKGQKFNSTRYSFFDKINRTEKGAKNISAKFPIGSTQICYINPIKPAEAVLERNIEAWNLLGLVPLVFTAAGVLGLWQRRKGKKTVVLNEKSEVELKTDSRMKKAIGGLIGGLICCGASIFLWKQMPSGISISSLHEIFNSALAIQLTFMSIVFGGIGLLLLFISITLFLATRNPVVRVKLMPSKVELGKTAAVAWEVKGRIERLQEFKILVECRKEEKIESRNNSKLRSTSTIKLYSDELYTTSNLSQIAKGEIGFMLGPNQAATFWGIEESIHWYIAVKGKIKRWPDIADEFEFEVLNQS